MSTVQDVPMCRLTERMVRSGLVMAWRLATSPTSTSPDLANPTTDGVVRPPSALGMTTGSPASNTATTELVVPRSIPTALAILFPPVPARCGHALFDPTVCPDPSVDPTAVAAGPVAAAIPVPASGRRPPCSYSRDSLPLDSTITITNLSGIQTSFFTVLSQIPVQVVGIRSDHVATGTAPPRSVAVERREPVHRVVRRRSLRAGRVRGPCVGPAPRRRRGPRPAGPPHLPADQGRPHCRADIGRGGQELAAGAPPLAPQRAPLRCPAGPQQEGDVRRVRRRAGQAVAPQLRHPAAGPGTGPRARPGRRPPLPGRAGRRPAAHRVPGRRGGPGHPLLGGRHRPRPAGRGAEERHRPGGGPRQQPARAAQAHRGHRRRRHRRPRGPDRHPLPLPPGRRPVGGLERVPGRPRGGPGRRRGGQPPGRLAPGRGEGPALAEPTLRRLMVWTDRRQRASVPRSPVRTRMTSSTGRIQTFPSPILPVPAVSTIAEATSSTRESSTRTSSRIFGTNSTSYSAPR